MSVEQAYTNWSAIYDTNENKTRDLEAIAIRKMLQHINYDSCLEIGCGTGKNSSFLAKQVNYFLGVDLTEAMLEKAKEKVFGNHIHFVQANILKPWLFTNKQFELITFSLVLEHIEKLNQIFLEVSNKLCTGGFLYIGELHPIKQYLGSKARFENTDGTTTIVEAYTHHATDFIIAAKGAGLQLINIQEFFDDDDRNNPPRILGLVFEKK